MRQFNGIQASRGGGAARAFTLIEIMIVVSIMAIVIASGIPAVFRAMKKDAMRQAVSDVMEACSHARAQAILQSVPSEFVLREDGSMQVQKVAAPAQAFGAENGAEAAPSSGGGMVFSAHLNPDIAIEFIDVNMQDQMNQAEVRVRFFPNGTSDEFTMILQSPQGSYKISLDVITGLASAEKIR